MTTTVDYFKPLSYDNDICRQFLDEIMSNDDKTITIFRKKITSYNVYWTTSFRQNDGLATTDVYVR